MSDTVVVGCGGGGSETIGHLIALTDIPAFTINAGGQADVPMQVPKNSPDGSFGGSTEAAYSAALRVRDEIISRISGFSNVVGVATLGGGAGFGTIYCLAQCAKSVNANFIAAITVPFSFEEDRRPQAEKEAMQMTRFSDHLIIMDMQRLADMSSGMVARQAIAAADLMIGNAVATIARLAETVPLLSTMPEKAYSFSYGDGATVSESVTLAMKQPMFELDPGEGKAIICPDAKLHHTSVEGLMREVADRTGIVPEIIQGTADAGNGVTVFMPVSTEKKS